MRLTVRKLVLGVVLACGVSVSTAAAEEGAKPLPVLLIKGEIVSLDTNDPAVGLLKVKDRYGFETPIYVTPEAKISQGGTPVAITSLSTGTTVDVEYNFDVNPAKRHAVSVKVPTPAAAPATTAQAPAAPAAPVVEPAAPAPAPSVEPAVETPVASPEPAEAPAAESAAPAPSEEAPPPQ